ncbi:MAG: GAF domain-containing protein [Acidobacteriota bacterium]|jgi:signal transduction histidine kinase/signal recognition particle receptor subunit beta
MVQFDNQYKQVKLKIVYYGPALGGKTTSLQYIHRVTDPQRRTKLYALNTASDRTLFFDLLGIDLGRIRGYRLTLQLYTVPGQVQYNATRRAVLAGADGVVFVADSRRDQLEANRESLANLRDNLLANSLDPETLPLVLQYNKRDLPDAMPRAELEAALNRRGLPAFDTVATSGEGIIEAFAAVTEATVRTVAERLGIASQPEAVRRLVDNVRAAMDPLLPQRRAEAVEAPTVLRPASSSPSLGGDELVAEAVRANVAMTDLNAQLDRLTQELARRVSQLRGIAEFTRAVTLTSAPEEVARGFLERLLAELGAPCGSLQLVGVGGALVEVQRRGLAEDPLVRASGEGSPAWVVTSTRQPWAVHLPDVEPSQVLASPWLEEIAALELQSALMVPLLAHDQLLGLATAYAGPVRPPFSQEELDLASVFAGVAAAALDGVRSWQQLEDLNRSLEQRVAERTRELAQALERQRALADELEVRNVQLEQANRQLSELERLKSELLQRVAHELNTPVTSIQTAARILSKYSELPAEKAAKFVGIIQQDAARLAGLIASALEAAVLGVAGTPASAGPVAISELFKGVLAPFRGEIAEKGIALQVKVAAGLSELKADTAQLEAALRALIKNAVEFNRPNGSITITVRPLRREERSFVEIRIEDSGNGIPAGDLPYVCDPFWQGGNVLTDKPRGLGLGLAVARRVARNHGGDLEISSSEGSGTSVSLLIATEGGGAS